MTPALSALLRTDPTRAVEILRADATISFWVKEILLHITQRDLVDALFDLDLLLNVVEALIDQKQGRTPTPASRVHPLAPDQEASLAPEAPSIAIDQCPAEILIGGTVDRLLIPEFLATLSQSGVCLGWEQAPFVPSTEPELYQAMGPEHRLHFYNGVAPEGELPLLETWLIEHQIGFTRLSMGSGSYQAERVQFRRGLRTPITLAVDPAGNELVPRSSLIAVLQYLKEHALAHAEDLLERTIGPSLAPLPPFRIADTMSDASGPSPTR